MGPRPQAAAGCIAISFEKYRKPRTGWETRCGADFGTITGQLTGRVPCYQALRRRLRAAMATMPMPSRVIVAGSGTGWLTFTI